MSKLDEWLLWLDDKPADVKQLYNDVVSRIMFEDMLFGIAFGLLLAGMIALFVLAVK